MSNDILFVTDWTSIHEIGFFNKYIDKKHGFNITHWSCKKNKNNNIFYRWYCYFIGAVYIIKNRKKYKTIVVWQQMIGYLFCIINILIPRTSHPQFVISTVLFSTNKVGLRGLLQKMILRISLKKSKALMWFSSYMANEVSEFFPHYKQKIHYSLIPIFNQITDKNTLKESLDDVYFRNGIFCGGKSDRDFNCVVSAFNHTNIPLTIVCPDNFKISETIISNNIRILRFSKVPPDQYYALIDQSSCVIISLKSNTSSCGQLLFSYAMSNSKPIIATDGYGVRDYIENNKNGMLFSLGNSSEINFLYNKLAQNIQFRANIINKAKETAQDMTPMNYFKKIVDITNNQ